MPRNSLSFSLSFSLFPHGKQNYPTDPTTHPAHDSYMYPHLSDPDHWGWGVSVLAVIPLLFFVPMEVFRL